MGWMTLRLFTALSAASLLVLGLLGCARSPSTPDADKEKSAREGRERMIEVASAGPLEELVWNTEECLLCQAVRTQTQRKYRSDERGFGFCEKCEKNARAFVKANANLRAGMPNSNEMMASAKNYTVDILKLLPPDSQNTDGGRVKSMWLLTCFSKWGDKEGWEEGWKNAILLGLRKSDITR
jgi:hypothetical protein